MATIALDKWVDADRRAFNHKKAYIHGALQGETGIISGVTEENKEDIFYMLMFCLCVPQSKAIRAEEAIEKLRELNFFAKHMDAKKVSDILYQKVRFHSVKAVRLVEARNLFFDGFWHDLKSYYAMCSDNVSNLPATRQFLAKRVNGFGMKLASHFMRNVGMAGLAILDVHILSGLKKRGVIESDKIISKSDYLATEEKMVQYARETGLTLDELDLLLWSQKTGYVFK